MGPSITASANVYAGGQPVMRVGDKGIHEPGYTCCGPNTWVVTAASGGVLVNGAAIVRVGDPTRHCGITLGGMQAGLIVRPSVIDGSPRSPVGPTYMVPPATVEHRNLAPGSVPLPMSPGPGDGCAAAVCSSAVGKSACAAAAYGASACMAAVCSAAACSADACVTDACAAAGCAAAACVIDLGIVNLCAADACLINIVPILPLI
jgi:uncharacterized Zn-binding protein involved in type VI secretion